VIKEAGLSHIY